MTEDLRVRVSYLKGLAEGLAFDEESKEGKLLLRIIDVLDEVAGEIEQLRTDYEELFEYTEALDEDLTELEDDFYEDLDEDDDSFDESFTVECPNCRKMVEISEDLLHEDGPIQVTCPDCGEVVLIDDEDWEDEDLDELLDAEDYKEESKCMEEEGD